MQQWRESAIIKKGRLRISELANKEIERERSREEVNNYICSIKNRCGVIIPLAE